MWLANARPSPRNAPNVRPRARPIIALLPNTRIIEILPRLNPPLRRHLLQNRHRRLVPPPRPVQRRPLLRWQRLARPLIPRRRLARPPNRQVNPRRFNRGMRNTICIRNSRLQAVDRFLPMATFSRYFPPAVSQSTIRDPHFFQPCRDWMR
jgi:hypothetical protein